MILLAAFEMMMVAALAAAPAQAGPWLLRRPADVTDRVLDGRLVRETQEKMPAAAPQPLPGGVLPKLGGPRYLPLGAEEKSAVQLGAAGHPAEASAAASVRLVEVSEPGTLVLLGVGLLALFAWSRRKQTRRKGATPKPDAWLT